MDLNKKFPGKRVVITGAGSGLGRAFALEFAKRSWNIAIAEINDERAKETAEMVKKEGGKAITIHCDVTKPEDLDNVLKKVLKEWKGVDILINNAGVNIGAPLEKLDEATLLQSLRVNAISPGVIDTPFHQVFSTPEMLRNFVAAIPIGRVGRPAECAAVIAFLAGDAAGYVVGETIEVNGGQLML